MRVPTPNSLVAVMTGSVSAYSHMGLRSNAGEAFHLQQGFTLKSSDPSIKTATISLDTSLAGYARAKHKSAAGLKLAAVEVRPALWSDAPLKAAHDPIWIEGTDGRMINSHLEPLQSPPMPLGPYVLDMTFIIESEASGVFDGHSTAEFSPGTTIPDSWVRTRDPFQGVDKTGFGFSATLVARGVRGNPFQIGEKNKSTSKTFRNAAVQPKAGTGTAASASPKLALGERAR